MGGIIEDKIFEVLETEKLTVKEIQSRLEKRMYENRTYETINKHLIKMFRIKVLEREKIDNKSYIYWNPLMNKNTTI